MKIRYKLFIIAAEIIFCGISAFFKYSGSDAHINAILLIIFFTMVAGFAFVIEAIENDKH